MDTGSAPPHATGARTTVMARDTRTTRAAFHEGMPLRSASSGPSRRTAANAIAERSRGGETLPWRLPPARSRHPLAPRSAPTTPWDSPRECSDDALLAKLRPLAEQLQPGVPAIFNLHSPPYRTGLDEAPELRPDLSVVTVGGQPRMIPVGSHAVRTLIEEYQPLLALHGHIHESRGVTKIGLTTCVNPGSTYGEGVLDGCLVSLHGYTVRHAQIVRG